MDNELPDEGQRADDRVPIQLYRKDAESLKELLGLWAEEIERRAAQAPEPELRSALTGLVARIRVIAARVERCLEDVIEDPIVVPFTWTEALLVASTASRCIAMLEAGDEVPA